MHGCIKGTACGLNPIGYSPTHSMRADKCILRAQCEGYICLPECVNFGNIDLDKGAKVVPTLPSLGNANVFYAGYVVQKAVMGRQCGLHASTANLMNTDHYMTTR